MSKTARKTIPFRDAHTYIAHIREYPPPPRMVSFNIGIFTLNGHTIKSFSTVTRNERSILWSAKVTSESLRTHITREQLIVNSGHRPSLETDNQ